MASQPKRASMGGRTGARQRGEGRTRLATREFLGLIPDGVRKCLPEPLRDFSVRGPVFSLIGLYYGADPRIHYEVWLQRRAGRIEIGLHFEADAETNRRGLEVLSDRAEEIVSALGPEVEGEHWDRGWTRIHQGLPLGSGDAAVARAAAERLAAFIRVLEPMRRDGSR
jgi:hypothetical protein